MVLAMASPYPHQKTRTYWLRKVVPQPLRAIVGKRELTATLGTKDPAEARRKAPAVMERFNAIIESAKAQHQGRAPSLSVRELDAILGGIVRKQIAQHADNPEDVEFWGEFADAYKDRFEPEDEGPGARRFFSPDNHAREEVAALLEAEGITADRATLNKAAERWAMMQVRFAQQMARHSDGDWRPDPILEALPAPTRRDTPKVAAGFVPISSLVEGWARENGKTGKALYDRQRTAENFKAFIGHDDAARVTAEDAVRWKEARLAAGRSPKTVANDLNEMQPIWRWAKANKKLSFAENPFAGIAPREKKTSRRARVPYTDAEARQVLEAARRETGALRWLPWVLCFTGARLGEVCQASKEDVKRHGAGGPWVLHIHEEGEGSTLKTPHSERMVPLHPALVAEGFLDHVHALPAGSPLWPDIKPDVFGTRKGTATKRHGRWVRQRVGITDERKDPAHAWRHLFEDRAHQANVPQNITDALMGHLDTRNEGVNYGRGLRFMPEVTAEWVARMADPLASPEALRDARRALMASKEGQGTPGDPWAFMQDALRGFRRPK